MQQRHKIRVQKYRPAKATDFDLGENFDTDEVMSAIYFLFASKLQHTKLSLNDSNLRQYNPCIIIHDKLLVNLITKELKKREKANSSLVPCSFQVLTVQELPLFKISATESLVFQFSQKFIEEDHFTTIVTKFNHCEE